jgi:hypothetical protein
MFILLCGYPPFNGDSNMDTLQLIERGVCRPCVGESHMYLSLHSQMQMNNYLKLCATCVGSVSGLVHAKDLCSGIAAVMNALEQICNHVAPVQGTFNVRESPGRLYHHMQRT